MQEENDQEKLLFRNTNIGFGKVGEVYFIEDAYQRVYLSADDIDRIASEMRHERIESLKDGVSSLVNNKNKEVV
jgi:hypothetical protein